MAPLGLDATTLDKKEDQDDDEWGLGSFFSQASSSRRPEPATPEITILPPGGAPQVPLHDKETLDKCCDKLKAVSGALQAAELTIMASFVSR